MAAKKKNATRRPRPQPMTLDRATRLVTAHDSYDDLVNTIRVSQRRGRLWIPTLRVGATDDLPTRRAKMKLASALVGEGFEIFENPRRHFPRTNRGRPKKPVTFKLDIYGGKDGELLQTKRVKVPRDEAYAMAKGMVGSKVNRKVVQKVIVDDMK